MSARDRKRREHFFAKHPFCCFCGGATPAIEEDHIPARHLFRGRQWPEGYVSCMRCLQRRVLADELVMG